MSATPTFRLLCLLVIMVVGTAFVPSLGVVSQYFDSRRPNLSATPAEDYSEPGYEYADHSVLVSRRDSFQNMLGTSITMAATSFGLPTTAVAEDKDESGIFAPSFVQQYEDFVQTPNGWSYRDATVGKGPEAALGDRCVFDWSGYTIGYFGRPFNAKGGPQGGAFDKDLDYSRTVLGSGQIVPALEQALVGMQVGGVRQVVVPYRKGLTYPPDDLTHERVGPKPATFSGQRALNFVLENPRVDRTLLFNVKVIRVDKPDGKGGFVRG